MKRNSPRGRLSDEEWARIGEWHLLSPKEIETIKAFRGNKTFLPIVWAIDELEEAIGPKGVCPDEGGGSLSNVFRKIAFEMRGTSRSHSLSASVTSDGGHFFAGHNGQISRLRFTYDLGEFYL